MKGRNRWFTALAIAFGILFMAIGGFSIWNLKAAETMHSLVYWSLGLLCSVAAVSLMKVWYWMEMQRIGVTREIKRLELQVACLSQRLAETD